MQNLKYFSIFLRKHIFTVHPSVWFALVRCCQCTVHVLIVQGATRTLQLHPEKTVVQLFSEQSRDRTQRQTEDEVTSGNYCHFCKMTVKTQ